jgi:alpha-ketoglutarate-dependent taurine dioxygenase
MPLLPSFSIDIPPSLATGNNRCRCALYSSLSPHFQKYLESLCAVHSGSAQANVSLSRGSGTYVRRVEPDTIHPVVRVHPVTGMFSFPSIYAERQLTFSHDIGWKSVFVNPGISAQRYRVFIGFIIPILNRFHPQHCWCSEGGIRSHSRFPLWPACKQS